MEFKNFAFQNNAVNKLYEAYVTGEKNIILQAPTGSGKTAILIKMMDQIVQNGMDNIAFVWLTPGAGELEEQSWNKANKYCESIRPQFLLDALYNGFLPDTATFLNWEIVNRKGNIALRDGEKSNLRTAIKNSKEQGVQFILIVDEEHRNKTSKAQKIIDMFDAKMMYRVSATPIEDGKAKIIKISEQDVIAEGLITREVVLNDQFKAVGTIDELNGSDQDFLTIAEQKRIAIKKAYKKLNKNINPLVLVQFPDESRADTEVQEKVAEVKNFLVEEMGQKEKEIAIWLSNQYVNTEKIEKSDSKVNYLLMKQAIATGWDAPRAKILIKLRLNTSKNFTIQTIGRIRRMPEQKHYDDDLLDNSFVYSNDEKYVYEIIKEEIGSGLTQMGLRAEIDPNMFGLKSLKIKNRGRQDVSQVTIALREEFNKQFGLRKNINFNKKQLEKFGWIFGSKVYSDILTGAVSKLEDLSELDTVSVDVSINDTRQWGFRYDSVMKSLEPYLHVGGDLKNVRAIIADLIQFGEPGSEVEPILQLTPKERYAFVINNSSLLKNIVKTMDAHNNFFEQQDLLKEENKNYKITEFHLKKREGYLDDGSKQQVLEKNIYEGYSKSNWVKQSKPERMLENELEKIDEVKWVYRSKDKGADYFSVPYDGNTREFYPDYLVKTNNDNVYILETKGGEGSNIDQFAEEKFSALKNYISKSLSSKVNFAFVRPSTMYEGLLLYNNTEWDESVDSSPNWKPLPELFEGK